jgi:putative spermidine/putrescine transport system permease protein
MAHARPSRVVARPPLAGPWALAPALVALVLLVGAGVGYALAQSLGALSITGGTDLGFQAYGDLLRGRAADDVWASAGFTLWVSASATLLAASIAVAFIAWLERPGGRRGVAVRLLHVNLAIPHVVWAIALLLVISQSGVLARAADAIGLIDEPAHFPALVGDRFGLGIIIHVATKEVPFLVLVGLALLRSQPQELGLLADLLGARGLRRVRLFVLPVVGPGVAVASAFVFAFVFGSYEAPVVLGASSPRMLSVVSLDLFSSPDLARRPAGMALGVAMSLAVGLLMWAAAVAWGRRRT